MPNIKPNNKDEQITVRVPGDLAAAVAAFAYQRSIPKSMVVREALAAYVANASPATSADAWGKVESLVGSLSLDPRSLQRDALSRAVRAHNWRK
ncbi:MAG TPA: hypothetical protein VHV78_16935 [Gemmatimonadaceae bacterium]|jgi:predicted transcriptional regulator|nr:hypothetical protein [Gemmatimonadaceae bacterium]